MRRLDVLGLPITAGNLGDICDELERWIAGRRRAYVCLANVHVVETARRNPDLERSLREADMVLADGAPIAWIAGRRGGGRVPRVAGSDLFEELCRRSVEAGHRHYFYGSTPETLARLAARVRERHPGIRICGSLSPPFSPAVEVGRDLTAGIDAARPDVVWVGLGAPKQECWMRRARELLEAPLLVGVGAVFDFASGTKARAPRPVQRLGLEWAFRLGQEPRRLSRRYLVTNTAFGLSLVREFLASGNR
jgi:N-acetylglucosaminyldiphosphoundecaprenol N-acetyl-beta-D-mannosaminyltransferase